MPYKNKDQQREYQRLWMKRRRDEYFVGKCCKQCSSTEELELDHIDPSKKISHSIWSWSASRRNAKLAKCQVLCVRCHRNKSKEGKTVDHGGGVAGKHNCKCHQCRIKKIEYYRNRRLTS